MPFLTRAQIVVLLHKRRLLDQARDDLVLACRKFSDGGLHSMTCPVGGYEVVGTSCAGVSASKLCLCGAEDPPEPSLDDAYREVGMFKRELAVAPPQVETHAEALLRVDHQLRAEREAGAKLPTITGSFGPTSVANTQHGNCISCPVGDDLCPFRKTCTHGGRVPG